MIKNCRLVSSIILFTLCLSGNVHGQTGREASTLDCNQLGWFLRNTSDFLDYVNKDSARQVDLPTSLYGYSVKSPDIDLYRLPASSEVLYEALNNCFTQKQNIVYSEYENWNPNKANDQLKSRADSLAEQLKQAKLRDVSVFNKRLGNVEKYLDNLLNEFEGFSTGSTLYSYAQLSEKLESKYSQSDRFKTQLNDFTSYKAHPNQEIRSLYEQHRSRLKQKLERLDALVLDFREQSQLEAKLKDYIAQGSADSLQDAVSKSEHAAIVKELIAPLKSELIKESVGTQAITQVEENKHQLTVLIIMTVITIFTCIGTIVGLMKKAPIYYDFDDLMFSAGIFAWPVAISLFIFAVPLPSVLVSLIIWGPAAFFAFKVISSTWKVGPKALLPIIVVTKIMWSLMLVSAILIAMNPQGKNHQARRSKRALALFFLAVATPIISTLIANKTGRFFNPNVFAISGVRGIDRVSGALKG